MSGRRKKSVSDVVNEQIVRDHEKNRYGGSAFSRAGEEEDEYAPVVDDFSEDDFSADDFSEAQVVSKKKAAVNESKQKKAGGSQNVDDLLTGSAQDNYTVLPTSTKQQKREKLKQGLKQAKLETENASDAIVREGKSKKRRLEGEKENKKKDGSSQLRRRGPLETDLTAGKYSGKRVNVKAVLDDIFGALDDDGSGDVEDLHIGNDGRAEEMDEAESSGAMRRKGSGAAPQTEDEYAEWYEARRQRKAQLRGAGVHEDDGDIIGQIEELRRTQLEVVGSPSEENEEDDGKDRKSTLKEVIRRHVMMHSQLLRVRVGLQPLVSRAVALPQYYALGLLCDPSQAKQAALKAPQASNAKELETVASSNKKALTGISQGLRSLIADYLHVADPKKHSASKVLAASKAGSKRVKRKRDADDDSAEEDGMSNPFSTTPLDRLFGFAREYHTKAIKDCEECVEYWGSRTVQANSVNLQVVSQPVLQQIHAVLAIKPRLLLKVQRNRSHAFILAHPDHENAGESLHSFRKVALREAGEEKQSDEGVRQMESRFVEAKAKRALHVADGDVDEEVYDDGDFVRELVRHGGSALASNMQARLEESARAMNASSEQSRRGLHRKTKGKAVNYDPRPKIVGFMVPVPFAESTQHEAMMASLFQ